MKSNEIFSQPGNKQLRLFLLGCIIEGLVSIFTTLLIPSDPLKAVLFGLSVNRLILLFLSLLIIGILTFLFFKPQQLQSWLERTISTEYHFRIFSAAGIYAFLFIWITFWTPTNLFGGQEYFIIRLKPFLFWIEFSVLQLYIIFRIYNRPILKNFSIDNFLNKFPIWLYLFILGFWVFISTTKIGLVLNTPFWNVPGVPLTAGQLYFLITLLITALLFYPISLNNKKSENNKQLIYAFVTALYIITVFVWGFTSLTDHFFSLEPAAPSFQPFPNSDARVHDIGAISIIKGNGIYFHGYTDKPMYMAILAFLHLFSGNNYKILTWLQILILALIPVILFLLGKKFHSSLFGLFIALIVIFVQKNAISLSITIASVNPKLLVTEEVTLLGIITLSYLLFQWIKTRQEKYAILLGTLTGCLSLIRVNPVFILPGIILTGIYLFYQTPRVLIKQSGLLILAFIIVFSPWVFTGLNERGESWYVLKLQDVIHYRYKIITDITLPGNNQINIPAVAPITNTDVPSQLVPPSSAIIPAPGSSIQAQVFSPRLGNKTNSLAYIIPNHFLHNFSTSLLAIPDSPVIENLEILGQRVYWNDRNNWDGNFPISQYFFILINLGMICLGIAYSWRQHQLAGLTPLIIFIFYDLSLGFALNSGSRYIVPINWILFFYYGIGILIIFKNILRFVSILPVGDVEIKKSPEITPVRFNNQTLIGYFILSIFIGAILPFANWGIPAIFKTSFEKSIPITRPNGGPIGTKQINGYILYPYYNSDKRTISFDFQSNTSVQSFTISRANLVDKNTVFFHDQPAIIIVDGAQEILSLNSNSLSKNGVPDLIWQKSK